MRTGSCRSTASPRSCTAGRPRSARSRRCTARSRSCGCSWSRSARPARPGRSSRHALPATGSAWRRTRSTSSIVERLADDAGSALASGDAETAVRRYRQALAQWRGAPLDDLAFEPFARPVIERLGDLRLTIAERCLGAELELGRGAELVAELEQLVLDNPLNERLRGQLMIALYRAGRQADALERFRTGRAALVEAFGLEPTPALKELERRVLQQDPSLDAPGRAPRAAPQEAAGPCSWPRGTTRRWTVSSPSVAVSPALGRHELLVTQLVAREELLAPAVAATRARRDDLERHGVTTRAAAFVSRSGGRRHGASGADARGRRDGGRCRPRPLAGRPGARRPSPSCSSARRATSRCSPDRRRRPSRAGSRCCSAGATTTGPRPSSGPGWPPGPGFRCGWSARGARGRDGAGDASRLLASASIAIQRLVGVEADPVLADPGPDGAVAAAGTSGAVVVGLSPRWRREGLGATRRALVATGTPTLIVHRGARPGGLAPRDRLTRFTWSLAGAG